MGTQAEVKEVMRKDFPKVTETDLLTKAHKVMEDNGIRALPVMKQGKAIGLVTLEDIGRVYSIASQKP